MGFISPTEGQVLEAYHVLCKKNDRGTSVTEAARYVIPHQASRNYTPGNTIYNAVYGRTRMLTKKGLLTRVAERVGTKGAVLYAPANGLTLQAAPEPPPPPRVSYAQIKDIFLGMDVTSESDLRDQAKMTQLMRAINHMPGAHAMIHRGSDGLWTIAVDAPPHSFSIGVKALAGMFPQGVKPDTERNKHPELIVKVPFSGDELDQIYAAIELLEAKMPEGVGQDAIFDLVHGELTGTMWGDHDEEAQRMRRALRHLVAKDIVSIAMTKIDGRLKKLYRTCGRPPQPQVEIATATQTAKPEIYVEVPVNLQENNQEANRAPESLVQPTDGLRYHLGKTIEGLEMFKEHVDPVLVALMDLEKDFERYTKITLTLHSLKEQLGLVGV